MASSYLSRPFLSHFLAQDAPLPFVRAVGSSQLQQEGRTFPRQMRCYCMTHFSGITLINDIQLIKKKKEKYVKKIQTKKEAPQEFYLSFGYSFFPSLEFYIYVPHFLLKCMRSFHFSLFIKEQKIICPVFSILACNK